MTSLNLPNGALGTKKKKSQWEKKKGKDGQEVGACICMLPPKILPQANPPLLLTNERIITFADMWRGGGEARGRGGVEEGGQCPLF